MVCQRGSTATGLVMKTHLSSGIQVLSVAHLRAASFPLFRTATTLYTNMCGVPSEATQRTHPTSSHCHSSWPWAQFQRPILLSLFQCLHFILWKPASRMMLHLTMTVVGSRFNVSTAMSRRQLRFSAR